MERSVRVLIARHGETEWNFSRRFQGHLDSPLTMRGQRQAELLSLRLAGEPISALYSSDLGRALSTAGPIASIHELPIQTSPLLREIDCGEWTGRTKEEIALQDPLGTECYRATPSLHRMPQGETLAEVQDRGLRFLAMLLERHPLACVAVISHHIVVETVLAAALGLDLGALWLQPPGGNCFLSELELSDRGLLPVTVYDGDHLGDDQRITFEGERVGGAGINAA